MLFPAVVCDDRRVDEGALGRHVLTQQALSLSVAGGWRGGSTASHACDNWHRHQRPRWPGLRETGRVGATVDRSEEMNQRKGKHSKSAAGQGSRMPHTVSPGSPRNTPCPGMGAQPLSPGPTDKAQDEPPLLLQPAGWAALGSGGQRPTAALLSCQCHLTLTLPPWSGWLTDPQNQPHTSSVWSH